MIFLSFITLEILKCCETHSITKIVFTFNSSTVEFVTIVLVNLNVVSTMSGFFLSGAVTIIGSSYYLRRKYNSQ